MKEHDDGMDRRELLKRGGLLAAVGALLGFRSSEPEWAPKTVAERGQLPPEEPEQYLRPFDPAAGVLCASAASECTLCFDSLNGKWRWA